MRYPASSCFICMYENTFPFYRSGPTPTPNPLFFFGLLQVVPPSGLLSKFASTFCSTYVSLHVTADRPFHVFCNAIQVIPDEFTKRMIYSNHEASAGDIEHWTLRCCEIKTLLSEMNSWLCSSFLEGCSTESQLHLGIFHIVQHFA
jgi:hypothetical protein